MDWHWRIVCSVLCWTLCALTEGFQWKNKETLIVESCVGSSATIPWTFSKDPGESVTTIHWFRFARQTIASLMDGKTTNPDKRFSPSVMKDDDRSVELTIGDVTVRDTGLYEVEVKVVTEEESNDSRDYKGWGLREKVYTTSALLVVGDPPTISGEALTIEEVTSHEACALQRQVTLRCGHFASRGVPPIEVVWTDPAGQQLPSTRFADGTFDLDLPRRPLPGNYTCHVQCQTPAIKSCVKPQSPLLTSIPPRLDLRPSASQGCSEAEVTKHDESLSSSSSSGEVHKDSPTVQKLKSNLTELREKLDNLQDDQKSLQEETEVKEEHFFAKVEELRELVLLSNQQSSGAQLHILQKSFTDLQNKFWELQQNFTTLQTRQNVQDKKTDEKQQEKQDLGSDESEVEDLRNSVKELRTKVGEQEKDMESMEERVASLSEGLLMSQEAFAALQYVLLKLPEELASSSPDHSQNFSALWENLDRLEERLHNKINSSFDNLDLSGAMGGNRHYSECCENLGDNMTHVSQMTSSRLKGVEEGLGRRVDRVASQCDVTKSEVSRLEWRMKKMERDGGGGGGGGGKGEEAAMDQPDIDPLVAHAEPTLSLPSPWDEVSNSLLHDFVITPDGHVIAADRHHAYVIVAKNASSSDAITTTRGLRYGSHIRRLTLMQNNLIAATVDDHYILILDIEPTYPENEQRWIRTSYPYSGIAARSAQTLYAGASEGEVGLGGKARVDVISVVNDVAVVVSTIMIGGGGGGGGGGGAGIPQLRNPSGLSLAGDDLYVSDWSSNAILRFSLESLKTTVLRGVVADIATPSPYSQSPYSYSLQKEKVLRFFQPRHAAFDVMGNMYVTTGGEMCDVSGGGGGRRRRRDDDDDDDDDDEVEEEEEDDDDDDDNDEYRRSESFCVVVMSREGWWSRLIYRGKFVYPYGISLTPTGLAVSWGMGSMMGGGGGSNSAMDPTRSLIQWYDLVPTNI